MPTNFPNGLASQGVPVIPGIPLTTGTYLFVHSGVGADTNTGRDKTHALATVQAAINKCTANKGDIIVLMPGHAETILNATAFNLSVAGVQIVGLGTGLLRPTFTFTTAATATWTVSAANCSITNCHFIANFLNVASAFTLSTAKDFQVTNCSFVDNSSVLNFLCIVTTNATNNAADGLNFSQNYVYGLAATDGAVVSVLGNLLRLQVCYNDVDKPGVTSDNGHLITMAALVCGGVRILGNILTCIALTNQSTGTLFTGSSTTSSGICADNYVMQTDTTAGIIATTGTKIAFAQNFMSGAADKSGTLIPVADDPT